MEFFFGQNLKTEIMKELEKSNSDKTIKNKYCYNSRTQIMTLDILTVVTVVAIVTSFSENILTPWQPMRYSQGSFLQFLQSFLVCSKGASLQFVANETCRKRPTL